MCADCEVLREKIKRLEAQLELARYKAELEPKYAQLQHRQPAPYEYRPPQWDRGTSAEPIHPWIVFC